MDWSLCNPRDLPESSSALQLEDIRSSVLSLLYGPTLTFIHDYWKNHSFDYLDLCRQSYVTAFWYAVYVSQSFPSKEQTSFNFMAAVTIHRNFGAQENKICHHFHFPPIYLPWSDGTEFFECWVLSQLFHFPLSPSSRSSLVPLCFLKYNTDG